MSFPRAIVTRPLLPLLFSTTLTKPFIKTSRPLPSMRPFTAFASLPASQQVGEPSTPAFPSPKRSGERWKPMCLYYTQGKCTMMEDPAHMEKFNHDCSRDLQVKNSMSNRICSQHLDYFLVLDLEGKIEILEFPVLIIDAKTMNVVDFFHRFVRPSEMSEKRINEYIEGKYGKFGVDRVWHDTAIPFKDVLQQFEEWLTQRQLWREEVGGCLNQAAFVTCGNWDLKTKVPEQCKVAKVKLPSYFMEWINLKDVYLNFYKRRATGMMTMMKELHMPLLGSHHLGFDDSKNIARVLQHMLADGAVLQITARRDHNFPEKMLDYNVPGGKLNRGLSVIDSYQLLQQGRELTEDEIFQASALGWCIEWLQAFFLVLDDMMDGSHTRRNQPCWFRLPKVGLIAANDGVLLRNHIPRILKKHFRQKPYYVDLVDLFNEVEFQTASGQLIDLITTIDGEKDLSKYSLSIHRRIVQYKTAYYSFYLSVACALLMSGEELDKYIDVKNLLVDMGIYFQVQDDYLDCFGDPETIGKIGTDIEDFKCSWLVVKALELSNEEQKKILHENYGNPDPAKVAKVKALYKELDLQGVFAEYERQSYEKLISSIEAHPSKAVQEVLKSFLGKIYKRKK